MAHENPDATVRIVAENPDSEVAVVGGQVLESDASQAGQGVVVQPDGTLGIEVLGTGGPPSGAAGGDLGGSYPNPSLSAGRVAEIAAAAAAAVAAQSDIDGHLADGAGAHAATAISFAPDGSIVATTVQAAIVEVRDEAAGGGAPTTADFLVGTAQGGLSAEIVVGATPGGELGGSWGSPTVDASHSGSTHAAVQAAAEATAAADATSKVAAEAGARAAADALLAPLASPTFTGDVIIPDEAYSESAWNGVLEPPTKNAVRDMREALPQLAPTSDIIPDVVTDPTEARFNLADEIGKNNDLTVRLSSQVRVAGARMATVAALPACTHSNGTAGVGATLTGDANGALADIDFTPPALGDWLLVKDQASTLQNGLYELTTLGTGGTPFVLTRVPCADEAADFLAGVEVHVGGGRTQAGSIWRAQATVTMGTTPIVWTGPPRGDTSPGGVFFGSNRNRRKYGTDFEELEGEPAVFANTSVRMPGTAFTLTASGAASEVAQVGGADIVPGAAALATGTATGGYANLRAGMSTFTFASTSPYHCFARVKIMTNLSDGTDTFICRVGSFPAAYLTAGTAPTAGIYFESPTAAGNWQAVCRNASTSTTVDTGVAMGTGYILMKILFDPITASALFYMNISGAWTLVATITTNLPTVALASGAGIVKSAGTNSRLLHVDRFDVDHAESRTLMSGVP